MGRRKAEEVFQSPAAAAGRKETGEGESKEAAGKIEGEGCRKTADSLGGQATKMTQVYSAEQREKKKNQNEAEEGNRDKSVVDNKDRTWCELAKIVVKGMVDVMVCIRCHMFPLWLAAMTKRGRNTREEKHVGKKVCHSTEKSTDKNKTYRRSS